MHYPDAYAYPPAARQRVRDWTRNLVARRVADIEPPPTAAVPARRALIPGAGSANPTASHIPAMQVSAVTTPMIRPTP